VLRLRQTAQHPLQQGRLLRGVLPMHSVECEEKHFRCIECDAGHRLA
jgi:hypothetical protein